VFAVISQQRSLARCEDLAYLCDGNEAYFRAEEKVITKCEPSWAAYAKALLAIRLDDLRFQRGELAKIQGNERLPVRVANMGWCGLQIGDGDAFKAPDEFVEVLQDYVHKDADVYVKYVALIIKWRSEIIKESGIDKTKCLAILRRYVPEEHK